MEKPGEPGKPFFRRKVSPDPFQRIFRVGARRGVGPVKPAGRGGVAEVLMPCGQELDGGKLSLTKHELFNNITL